MNYHSYQSQKRGLVFSLKFWLATFFLIVLYTGILFGQTTVYIDPTAPDGGDGSQGNPYNEWSDVHPLQSNTSYLQKRGTTALLTDVSGANGYQEYGIGLQGLQNTYIGAYGSGSRPVLQCNDNEPDQHIVGDESTISVTIEGLYFTSFDAWNDFETHIRVNHNGSSASGKVEIRDCEFTHGNYAAILPGGQLDSLIVENCIIHNVGQEGIWGGCKNAIIRGNHLYDINMKYWWVGHDETSAGGDAIQLGPGDQVNGGHLLIENNIIDRRSTGNKFCLIVSGVPSQPNYQGINFKITLRYNTIYPPIEPYSNSNGGGALYVEGVDHFVAYGNHFSGRDYDTDYGRPTFLGYVMANEGDYFYYNVFDSVGQLALREDDNNAAGYPTNQHSEFHNNMFIGTPANFAYCVFFEEEAGFQRTVNMTNNMFGHPSGLAFGSVANEGTFTTNTNNLYSVGSSNNWNGDLGIIDWEDGNFSPVEGGPAHNSGFTYSNPSINGILYDRDFDSTLVPNGIRDIGVLEYQQGPSSGTIYIDPTNGGDPAQDGSLDHPYDQWSDVEFVSNSTYLQKRGTTVTITSNITLEDVQNITIGAYDDGSDPVLKSDGAVEGFRIEEGCNGILIENFNIHGGTDYSGAFVRAVYIDGDETGSGLWVESVTIRNCTIAYQNNGLIIQPWSTGLESLLVENCVIHDIKQEGIWGAVTNPTIRNCHLYNINMDWHFTGHTQAQAGGDALLLQPGPNAVDIGGTVIIENNIIDRRSTGNNFCLMYSDPNSEPGSREGIFNVYIRYNTFYPPKDTTDDEGGSVFYIDDADSTWIYGNTFNGKGYDIGSQPQDLAFINFSYVDCRYNLFDSVNYFLCLNNLDREKVFYNNTFVNCPGTDGQEVLRIVSKAPELRGNIVAGRTGAQFLTTPSYSGPVNDTSNNIIIIGEEETWQSRIGFVDWENENYTLLEGSPAHDYGYTYSGWNYDIDSIQTPQGTARDVGACEYPEGSQSNLSPEIEDQEFGIEENVMVGSQVGVVEATDPNAGQILTFSIVSGNTEDAFAILPQSGQLLVVNADAINYEENPQFLLEVEVEDNGVGNLSSQATVTVNLTDVNEVPEIEDQSFQIEETIATGAQVGMVEATDPDVGQTLTWTITSGNVDGAFAMDAATGELSIADNTVLNFSVTPQYTLTVEVEDNGPGNLSADATVTVELQEVNLAPVIEDQQFSIDENQPDGSQVGTVEATDPNAGQTLSYSIVSGNLEGAFSIGTTSGILTVANSEALNHEQTAEFYLIVEVSDDGAGNLSDLGTVTVQVNDINEPPVMDDQNFVVEEGIGTGEQVGMVQAEDPDAGQALTWSITAGNDEGIFAVDGSTGALSIADNSALNFSQTPVYFLDMQVQDNGTGELTDEAVIAVSTDELNQAPSIENQQFSIEENSAAGTLIGQVEAIDPDAGQTLTYSIVSGNVGSVFALNPQSGDLTVDNSEILNYEQHQSFSLTVKVEDDGIGNLSDEATVTVEILDVNEVPVVEETIFSLQENSPEGTQVGQVTAQDPDAGQQVSYAIISGNIEGSFTIDNVSGMVSIANAAGVNFETTPVFYLVVEATDNGAGSLSGQGVITINVDDINEVPVIEDQYFTAEASSPEGSQVGEVEAMDPDNGQELTYSILSGNTQDAFTIDGSSGMITVSNSAALNMTVNPIFILQVEVEDNGTGNLTAQASVVIVLMNPTSVGETFSGDFNCSLYPNPATTQVNLEVNIPQGEELSIQVIDFMGQVVHQETHPASAPRITTQLQVASYEGGMYVIVLRSGEHLKQLKLIKQ